MELIKNSKGFTLLEITVGILIASLLLIPAIKLYNINQEKNNIRNTRGNMQDIANAINIFFKDNGRYPIPSNLNLSQNDLGLGLEGPLIAPVCPDLTVGMCITPSADPTLIGAVPFDALQIDHRKSLDAWSNKIIYAVAASQTNAATYVRTLAAPNGINLNALDSYTGAVIPLTASPRTGDSYTDFDMVLISTGPTAKGGYSAEGVLIEPCIELGNPENEDENCDFSTPLANDNFLIDHNPRFDPRPPAAGTMNAEDNGTKVDVPGLRFYDDITFQQEIIPASFWNENLTNNDKIVSDAMRIGIGEPLPDTQVHVRGDMRVVGVNQLRTGNVCDANATNCFETRYVASQENTMNCHDGNTLDGLEPVIALGKVPVAGVATESVICGSSADSSGTPIVGTETFNFPNTINRISCLGGTLMRGINSSGDPICVPIP